MMYFLKSKEVFSGDRLKLCGIYNLFLDTSWKTGFNTGRSDNRTGYRSGYLLCILQMGGSREKAFFLLPLFASLGVTLSPCFRGVFRGLGLFTGFEAGSPTPYRIPPQRQPISTLLERTNGSIENSLGD
jgi:hypothetical protein